MTTPTPREILLKLEAAAYNRGYYHKSPAIGLVSKHLADLKGAVLAQIPVTRIEYHDADCEAYKGSEWCHCPGKSAAETREALDAFRKAILTMFEGE